jgi:flagellar secretion chaperone FliS
MMFGFNQKGINSYAQVSVETGVLAASPNKLTIMLYEGAITACRSAIVFMQKKDIQHKGEMLSKAIMIIESGLRLSLDKKAGGEIAESLDSLYAYMSYRLMLSNIRNEPEIINEVIKLLTELKDAWETIGSEQAKNTAVSQLATTTISNQNELGVNPYLARYAGV